MKQIQAPIVRVTHVVASTERETAGPSYTVPRLARELGRLGHEVDLISLGSTGTERVDGYKHTRYSRDFVSIPLLRAMALSSGLRAALRQTAPSADVIHNHGLWLMPNVYCGRAARAARIPLVMAPRGMLGPGALRFSRSKKRLFWSLLQRRAADATACWHATSEKEYEDIRAFGLRQPVAVVPNGIDLPELPLGEQGSEKRILYLGRLHPKKGIDNLIAAWAQVATDFPDWNLDIVGPGEGGHEKELAEQAAKLGCPRVSFPGPASGGEKYALYRRAGLFVLPTRDENFGMTVAEALSAGTPVISTKGAPWSGLESNRCGWWIDHGIDPLARTLREAMSLSAECRREMGERGRQWMVRDFSWPRIASDLCDVYRWLGARAEQPATVRLN